MVHPSVKVFDVLWVNGKDISAYPFKERQKVLCSIFTELPTRFEHVSRWTVGDVVELKGSLERIILQKGEGLVVKSPLSTYEYGGRSDRWIKVCSCGGRLNLHLHLHLHRSNNPHS